MNDNFVDDDAVGSFPDLKAVGVEKKLGVGVEWSPTVVTSTSKSLSLPLLLLLPDVSIDFDVIAVVVVDDVGIVVGVGSQME